jgi:hypothetical protein
MSSKLRLRATGAEEFNAEGTKAIDGSGKQISLAYSGWLSVAVGFTGSVLKQG